MVRRSGRSARRAGEGQLDLLVALPGDIPTHDQQDMMERPFFSLSSNAELSPSTIRYRTARPQSASTSLPRRRSVSRPYGTRIS